MPRIDIKFVDGSSVSHSNIKQSDLKNGVLTVINSSDDVIHYGPSYWAAYVEDPKGDDPLNLH
jgi:hypothetical protein